MDTSKVCMRCGKEEVEARGLCKVCNQLFKYMYGYECIRGHFFFSVLNHSVRCCVCFENEIKPLGGSD